MTKYPQVLLNVKDLDKDALQGAASVWEAKAKAEAELQDCGGGRVLLRASGTEPVVRVMVEATSEAQANAIAADLAAEVAAALGRND
jgi:phosphoglucosamine mutase